MTTTDTNLEIRTEGDRWSPALAQPPRVFIRIALGVTAAFVAGCLAVISLLVGVTATTGCLFSCEDPNLLLGIPALVATAALATVSLVALWWALVDRFWATTLKTLMIAGSMGAVALIVGTLAPA